MLGALFASACGPAAETAVHGSGTQGVLTFNQDIAPLLFKQFRRRPSRVRARAADTAGFLARAGQLACVVNQPPSTGAPVSSGMAQSAVGSNATTM
jgi:hypothetical protein